MEGPSTLTALPSVEESPVSTEEGGDKPPPVSDCHTKLLQQMQKIKLLRKERASQAAMATAGLTAAGFQQQFRFDSCGNKIPAPAIARSPGGPSYLDPESLPTIGKSLKEEREEEEDNNSLSDSIMETIADSLTDNNISSGSSDENLSEDLDEDIKTTDSPEVPPPPNTVWHRIAKRLRESGQTFEQSVWLVQRMLGKTLQKGSDAFAKIAKTIFQN